MERKFKVGDTVKDYQSQKQGKIVYVDEGANLPYLIVRTDKNGICNSTWCKESELTLIEPERKFKTGDEVWHKQYKQVEKFYEYYGSRLCSAITRHGDYVVRSLSEIEPYTGQDKYFNGVRIHSGNEEQAKPHPFTVILKSGVKIGVTEDRAKQLNADLLNKVSSTSILENKVEISGVYFKINSIAAIVPTKNLMP